jgi:hypothetical protein
MTGNDEKAREARARRLREQIDQLAQGDEASKNVPPEEEGSAKKAESPREFIHRKMRELDKKKRP